MTPFHLAADDKNSKATYGMTPFHFAAENGQVSVCQLIHTLKSRIQKPLKV